MTDLDKVLHTFVFEILSTWFKRNCRLALFGGGQTWRVSFSLAEKTLAKSLTGPQRRCFLLIKFIFKDIIKRLVHNEEVLGIKLADDREFYFSSFSLHFHICS